MRLLLVLMTSKIYFLNRFLKKCLFSDEMRVTANREKFEWFSKNIWDAAKHPDILWFGIIRKLNYKTLWKCWVSLILIFFDDLEHFDYFVPQIIWKFINRLLPPPNLKKKIINKNLFFYRPEPSTQKPADNDDQDNNGQWKPDPNPGQWEWKPPTTTTTETSFIETSNVAQPLSGDYKVVCCK